MPDYRDRVASQKVRRTGSLYRMVDSDIRLSGELSTRLSEWCPSSAGNCWGVGVAGRYDVQSPVTHEVGHRVGFGHVLERDPGHAWLHDGIDGQLRDTGPQDARSQRS